MGYGVDDYVHGQLGLGGGGDISMMIMTLMTIIENVVVTPWMASKWTSSVYNI